HPRPPPPPLSPYTTLFRSRTDRVRAGERLRGQRRASTDAIRVQLAAGEVAGAIRGKHAHRRRNRGDRSVPLDPAESKGVVALEHRVVVRRCGRTWAGRA